MGRSFFSFIAAATKPESGNVFFTLFGAVALVGVVGVASMQVLKGPVRTMAEVTKRTVAENNMIASTKLAIISSANQPSADCDFDGFIEPIEPEDPGAGSKPVGGGYLPSTVGAALNDPWSTRFALCAWDHGGTADKCGGTKPMLLTGGPIDNQYAIAVISAGSDRIFQTACNDFVDANDDDIPDTALITHAAGNDDITLGYTYAEANNIGGGLWTLKDGDNDKATIAKDIEVRTADDSDVAFALDRTSGMAEFMAIKTDNIYAKSAAPGNIVDIVDPVRLTVRGYEGLVAPTGGGGGGGGGDLWTQNGTSIYYSGGSVGIGTDSPWSALSIQQDGYAEAKLRTYSSADQWTSAGIVASRARGTAASPSYSLTNDRLGFFLGGNGLSNSIAWAGMSILASENHSVSAQGAHLQFSTVPDGAVTSSERMRIESGGNVGIGTTDPGYRLHVAGTGVMALFDGTNSDVRVDIKNDARRFGIKVRDLSTGDDTFFITDETAGSERVSLDSTGNVGIGLSDPQHKLHVSGNIHATGNITCDGTCGGGGGASGNTQTFNASGTWTKPGSGTLALVECWGGGGGGARGSSAGGGGGGGYNMKWLPLSSLGATETVTIGSGGTGRTGSDGGGTAGGNSTFGAHLTAYGGGLGLNNSTGNGGGGGGGPAGAGGTYTPGAPNVADQGRGTYYDAGGYGASAISTSSVGGFWHGGGGGGYNAVNASGSVFGGGGGGGYQSGSAGASTYGGAGGAGGTCNGCAAGAGTQPGGGGGGTRGANAGNGGAGRCKVTVF